MKDYLLISAALLIGIYIGVNLLVLLLEWQIRRGKVPSFLTKLGVELSEKKKTEIK